MHMAPKQILVNVRFNVKDGLTSTDIVKTVAEVEAKMKEAEPKVDMIFLEVANLSDGDVEEENPKHIG